MLRLVVYTCILRNIFTSVSTMRSIIFAKYFFEYCISECIDISTIRESLLCRKILSSAYLNIFEDFSIYFKTILITITSQENSIWWPKKNQTSFRALRHGELNIGESRLDYPCAFLNIYEYMHNLPWWMFFLKVYICVILYGCLWYIH